jgi:predicted nucleic acid-binding protein
VASLFLDTSAVVKRYILEAGTSEVHRLADPAITDSVHIAHITIVECVAAVARRARVGDLSDEAALVATENFLGDCDRLYDIVPIETTVVARAVALACTHVMRGYDAVQLAAALCVRDATSPDGLILVSADRRMCQIARAEGMDVIDPTAEDAP